jgi:opacity protein-like surface antigen
MRLQVIAAATILLAGAAHAQTPEHRFYVSLHAGQDAQDDEAIRGFNVANAPRNNDLTFDDGRVYAAALGINAFEGEWGRVRFDAELSHREADLDTIFLNNVEQTVRQGSHVLMTAAMLNAYYDTPVYFDHVRFYTADIAIPTAEPTWSYQLVGGGEYILTPNWSLLADVRFVEFGDLQIQRFNLTAGALDSVNDVQKKSSVSVTAGLRYAF